MTTEQEDAHWALQGKPLMRHWRAYCRAVKAGSRSHRIAALTELARALREHGISAADYRWTWLGIEIDGVFYSHNVEGL